MRLARFGLLGLLFVAQTATATAVVRGFGRDYHTGLLKLPEAYRGLGATYVELADCEGMPANFDLRDFGVVGPVKDQGSCGSCWSFSKTASLESAVKAAGGALLDLSEQELVSCDRNNYGCNGGLLNRNEYQVVTGQGLEADFRYTATDARCKTMPTRPGKAVSFVRVRDVTVEQVKCALFKSHTIPWITVSAGGSRWSNPPTGDDAVWPTPARNGSTNHAIGLVGWKELSGKTYFIARNSWGNRWGSTGGRPGGERGYALMPLGADALGEEVAYATAGQMPCDPPKPLLPVEVVGNPGDELVLAVKPDVSATYRWFKDQTQLTATGATATVTVDGAEAIYRVQAENSCGRGESRVRVRAVTP